MAKKLPGVPVLTGKDRGVLGEYALRNFSAAVVLLDDGFQHLKLRRNVDIILLDGQKPLGNGFLLPRGPLREPPDQLKRANFILVTQLITKKGYGAIKRLIRTYNRSASIFFADYVPVTLERLDNEERLPLEYLRGKEVLALAGVARPESFSAILIQLGARLVGTMFFPDHHRYQPHDLDKAERNSVIVTTEKDAIKLRAVALPKREVLVLGIALTVENEARFQESLKNHLPWPI